MIKLSDFFQPLNPVNLLYAVLALFFFDVLGTLVKNCFVKNEKFDLETRLVNWLMGLGIFIFIWFVAGFFIAPTRLNLLISLSVLLGISLPYYLKNKKYSSLSSIIKPLVVPILLLVPLLPAIFVKASLPPYTWDEMAYHFISPSDLQEISSYWVFSGGVYGNVPRLIDTLYILGFSLLHTYSVVRLIQAAIFITALLVSFKFIRKLLGLIPAALFILIFLGLPIQIPSIATVGYVDVAAYSFLLLGFVFGIIFLFSNLSDHLVLSIVFWTMSIGTKYTTLVAFAAFAVSLVVVYWIKNKSLSGLINGKALIKITVGLIVFGGYWYIKNFIIYGNPIYPFIFQCWGKYAQTCGTGTAFFGKWTTPININNAYFIITELLSKNIVLHLTLVASPLLVLFFGNKKNKLLLLMFILTLGVDIMAVKYFSGFLFRYQQYWEFVLVLIIVLFTSQTYKRHVVRTIQIVAVFLLVGSSIVLYVRNVWYLNTPGFVNRNELYYALGLESINTWVGNYFPKMKNTINWCQSPPGGSVALARFDPELIWYSYEGLMRIYMTNCYYSNPSLEGVAIDQVLEVAVDKKMQFWIASGSRCIADAEVSQIKEQTSLRRLNNIVICNSIEIQPNLYYFDYQKLK